MLQNLPAHLRSSESGRRRRRRTVGGVVLASLLALTAACGASSDRHVQADRPPRPQPRSAFAAEARRYVDLQLSRAATTTAADAAFRAALSADAQRYVALQLDRAASAHP